jgi:hypothetical protein
MAQFIESNSDLINMRSFDKFINYLTRYELKSPSHESIILQRLKVLTSSSKQYVGFKEIGENSFQVYSSHESIPPNIKLGDDQINDIIPCRSVVFDYDGSNVVIRNYSIMRLSNVPNAFFVDKMCAGEIMSQDGNEMTVSYPNIYESFEGTTIVAHRSVAGWNIRTNSCVNANDSYFITEKSHYSLMTDISSPSAQPIEEKLTDLQTTYSEKLGRDVYFVFVLVCSEQKYLCDYGTSKIVLINVRDSTTHEELPVEKYGDWYEVPKMINSDDVKNALDLESNCVFSNNYLQLQGFIIKDRDNRLFRTFTKAYEFGTRQVSNHGNLLVDALRSYMRGTFSSLVAMRSIEDDHARELAGQCKTVINSIRNILAYMFTVFTSFKIEHEDVVNESGNTVQRMKKSYTKKNLDFYKALFVQTENSSQPFCKVLPLLQSYSVNSQKFNSSDEIATATEKFVRTLAYNDTSMQLLIDMLYQYKSFRTHLDTVVKQNNTNYKRRNGYYVKEYNYVGEDRFNGIIGQYFTPPGKNILVTTDNVVVKETGDRIIDV